MIYQENAPNLTVLQRCDRFVGRTMNWLYDHVRSIPRHVPVVLADQLQNREEFPLLEARSCNPGHLSRRIWRRFMGARLFPADVLWLRRSRPTLLHSHFGYVAVNDFGLRAFLDVPWLVGFYGADVYELGRREEWRDKYAPLFVQADLVLALGPAMATQLAVLGCPQEKITVHPLGVDIQALPNRVRELRPGAPLKILFAGTFREKKGIEYIIRGAAKARQKGVRLQVTLVGDAQGKAGDLETKESVFREIRSLDLTDVVIHRPFVEFTELMQLALESHLFIAPSVTAADGDAEGTPFVLQQMMATGMPVIATIHSDIPYIFGEHKNRLVPERDADAIALRFEEYIEEPERLAVDGIAFRERIRTTFDVQSCAARLAQLYDRVISRSGDQRSEKCLKRVEASHS